jgi:hypothetical protein
MKNIHRLNRNIYITNEQEIKEGDWYLTFLNKEVIGKPRKCEDSNWNFSGCKKIILTTDQDLIKDGVQAIDNKTLELLANNPTCVYANIEPLLSNNGRALFGYNLSIPQEEKMYSEEEVLTLLINFSNDRTFLKKNVATQWFKEFKKK